MHLCACVCVCVCVHTCVGCACVLLEVRRVRHTVVRWRLRMRREESLHLFNEGRQEPSVSTGHSERAYSVR